MKISKNIMSIANFVAFASFIVASAFMFRYNRDYEAILLLYASALYIIFVKLNNIDERLKGI